MCDVAPVAEGSAQAFIGMTHVIAGVRLEAAPPVADHPVEGVLHVHAGKDGARLAWAVERTLRDTEAVDLMRLCIEPGRTVWHVWLDVRCINDDGSLVDACVLASVAALATAQMPRFDGGRVVRDERIGPLMVDGLPVTCTLGLVDGKLVADLTREEGTVADAKVRVTFQPDGALAQVMASGRGTLSSDKISQAVALAKRAAPTLREGVLAAVARFKKA
jgi:exosome complex component RRP42